LGGKRKGSKKETVLERINKMETLVNQHENSFDIEVEKVRKRKLPTSSPESTLDDSDADPDYKVENDKRSLSDSESESSFKKVCKLVKKRHKLMPQPPSKMKSKPQHSQLPNPVMCGSSEVDSTACNICGILVEDIKEHHEAVHWVDNKQFECEECGKWFNESQELRDHKMNVHLKLRPYKSNITSNDSSNRKQLEKMKHVDNPIYYGSSELASGELAITLDRRETVLKAGQHHQQPVQQGQFVVKQQPLKRNPEVVIPASPGQIKTPQLETGRPLLENETPLSCESCGRQFMNLGALFKHSKACLETYACDVCNIKFKKLKYLKIHVKKKHMAGQIPCEHCEMKFKSQPKLNKHLKSHLTPSAAKCNICEKVYKNANVLKVHKYKVHLKKDKSKSVQMWKCDLCPKVYQSDRGLRAHKVIHKKFGYQDQENVDDNFEDQELEVEENNEPVEVDSRDLVVTNVVDYIIS